MWSLLRAGPIPLTLAALQLGACAQTPTSSPVPTTTLAGSSWQLVKFTGGDDKVLIPDAGSNYTVQFVDTQVVAVRFDCNRGRGGWNSPSSNRLEFGAMAMTRAQCAPGSLHDDLLKRWPYVRSYVLKNGRLYLSLQADGGVFEFEPGGGK